MEALVIEEPPPSPAPEPIAVPAPAPATPVVQTPKRRTRPRTEPHDTEEQAEPTDSLTPASPAEVPSLEPQSDPRQDEGLRNQLQARENEIKRRITELEKNTDLSTTERRTLTDAASFWTQSVAALRDHDLLRARELAQKAALLLTALEKR
jgi:outer membrane biosynthesis protein TonB